MATTIEEATQVLADLDAQTNYAPASLGGAQFPRVRAALAHQIQSYSPAAGNAGHFAATAAAYVGAYRVLLTAKAAAAPDGRPELVGALIERAKRVSVAVSTLTRSSLDAMHNTIVGNGLGLSEFRGVSAPAFLQSVLDAYEAAYALIDVADDGSIPTPGSLDAAVTEAKQMLRYFEVERFLK